MYMKQREGFVTKGQEHLVCRLKRSIYDLKQSSRCWNTVLDKKLKKMGFVQTDSDPCIYVATEGEMFVIAVHVDDTVLATKSDKRMAEVKKGLAEGFEVKDMGELHHFLGVKVIQNPQIGEVWIGQEAYAQRVLQKFGMENAKPINTPVDASSKLVKTTEGCEGVDQAQFQSAVGSLLYLSIMT